MCLSLGSLLTMEQGGRMRELCGQISDDLVPEEGFLWGEEPTLQSSFYSKLTDFCYKWSLSTTCSASPFTGPSPTSPHTSTLVKTCGMGKALSCVSNVHVWKCTLHPPFLTFALDTVFFRPTRGTSCAPGLVLYSCF